MLKYFEVKGFKNFTKGIKLDFADVRDYQFNNDCVANGLLSKIIIYGKNSVGKSNMGLALFDITTHLTDNNVSPGLYDYYLSADELVSEARFKYVFQFDDTEVTYEYHKSDVSELTYEKVYINNDEVLTSERGNNGLAHYRHNKNYLKDLNFEFKQNDISILRYVVNNTIDPEIEPLKKLVRFVSKMLWFRSLNENRYIGYKTAAKDYYSFIFEKDNLPEFQEFLYKAGINEILTAVKDPSGDMALYFEKDKPLPFHKVSSNGTKALYTLFYWLKTSAELSLLFIDEFDAYYHVELSETIVTMLEGYSSFQTILTSHNTNLLSNRIMRPDCYFILTQDKMVSFANATSRELREGHNLEKLYVNGEFDG